jgi:exopolysaccharide biosynthesis polyprenyl glycosylphosphotransferase
MLGTLETLTERIGEYGASSLLLSVSSIRSHEILPQLRPLRYTGIELMDYVALSEEIAQEIPLAYINDEWLMTATLNSSILQVRKIKRAMDVLVSSIGLLLGVPIMLLAGALIKMGSPGPMFYKQTRVGMGGKPYTLFKLRTMRADAESNGAVWAQKKDPRVTGIGYYLRKWRIDEIPQLFNIIKGEMSLVGPRPERPEFTEKLAAHIPFYDERHLVPPGLTGWAQVRFPYAASFDAAARKLQFDLYYIKNMSFLFDVAILFKTIKTILKGLRHEDESLLQTGDKLEELLAPPSSVQEEDGDRTGGST